MRIVFNEKKIRRKARLGQIAGLGGMAILVVGMIISFKMPDKIYFAWGALLFGFAIAQVGMYFTNRYVRRLDMQISQALKGLDGRYTLYHYETPASHLLVGPAGVWVLIALYQRGTITYENGRWRQSGGGFSLTYLKIFGQESLGRPEIDVQSQVHDVEKYLKMKLPPEEVPPIKAALVFTDERADLRADNAPIPTLSVRKLKEVIRKAAKEEPLSLPRVKAIQDALEQK